MERCWAAAHRDRRSAERALAGWAGNASFIALVPPVRGGSVMTEPSPRTPAFQWRYGSNGAAAEWVMLIHWEFQRSAGLKLHGCLLVGGRVFKVLQELLPFAFKPCIKWTQVQREAFWQRGLIIT